MKILITGSNGLLGQKLLQVLTKNSNRLYGIDKIEETYVENIGHKYIKADLTNRRTCIDEIYSIVPDVIVHTAAMTGVDDCETEKELCWNTNVVATDNVITGALKVQAKLIFISSDYIFDGKKGPYIESDLPNPINYYGRSKLAAENLIRGSGLKWSILRTIVIYGLGINIRSCFVTWLLEQLRDRRAVKIVNDQWGNSTIVDDLAAAIDRIISLDKTGIYHVGNLGFTSRYEFALKIAKKFDLLQDLITPVSTSSFNQIAQRPLRSGLEVGKAERELYITFRTIEEALDLYKRQEDEIGGS